MSEVLLAIGTGKGLFLARSGDGRASWQVSGPHFAMNAVYAIAIDTRGERPRLLAGARSEHWGRRRDSEGYRLRPAARHAPR